MINFKYGLTNVNDEDCSARPPSFMTDKLVLGDKFHENCLAQLWNISKILHCGKFCEIVA